MEFSPFSEDKIRGHRFKNRIIAAPMASGYASPTGEVSDRLLRYYTHLALTGVAAVIVEGVAVSSSGKGWANQITAFAPESMRGLSNLADCILERGAQPVLQLHHPGRQSLFANPGDTIVGASSIPCPVLQKPVRALTAREIRDLVVAFTDAARYASQAGFVGIELHGAHGYLLHQFVSPLTNTRKDEYGLYPNSGSKFPLEIVRSIRTAFPDLIISYRISARDYLPRGLRLNQSVLMARALDGAGVDIIHVSGGSYPNLHGPRSLLGPTTPDAVFRDDARDIREAVNTRVMVTGKIQHPQLAFDIISNQDAHLVGVGRMLLRDSQWIQKAKGQNKEPVISCLLCQRCQYHHRGCPDMSGSPSWEGNQDREN